MTLCLTVVTEKAMTLSLFSHYNTETVRLDPIAPDGSPSQFCTNRDFVNISATTDIAFLFRGIQGKSQT